MLGHRKVCAGLIFWAALSGGAASAASHAWTASPDKVGPLKFGMGVTEAFKAIGASDALTPEILSAVKAHCEEIPVPGQTDTVMMFENAKLSRVTFYGDSPLRTTLGIGIGASESEVMGKYPKAETAPNDTSVPPARDLIFWNKLNVSGIRFETNTSRAVEVIHIGGQSITYVGGCT
jgi:hypothetical protein